MKEVLLDVFQKVLPEYLGLSSEADLRTVVRGLRRNKVVSKPVDLLLLRRSRKTKVLYYNMLQNFGEKKKDRCNKTDSMSLSCNKIEHREEASKY